MGEAREPDQSIGCWFRLSHRGDRQQPGRRETLRAMKQIRQADKRNQTRHVNDGVDLGFGGLIDSSGPLLGLDGCPLTEPDVPMLSDREWDALVDMVVTARNCGRRARRDLDRFYDRRAVVDFVEVVSYACALLVECMRLPDGTFPAESEVRRLGVQLYPAWRRTARDQPPATLLNILMSMMGYDDMQATGLATCTHIVVAIAALLPAGVDTRVAVAEKRDMVERVNAIRQAEREAEAVTDRPDERDG